MGKAQGRVVDQRKDAFHKLTTTLARNYGTIVVEDLLVAGMLGNHHLARHVADASFGQIRRQLEYKTKFSGGLVLLTGVASSDRPGATAWPHAR